MANNTHNDNDQQPKKMGYASQRQDENTFPLPSTVNNAEATEVIRQKLDKLFAAEPDPVQEEREAEAVKHRSKHQQFMYDLNRSGKDLAQIQTEWHSYYLSLPDAEKHAVWQEFYASNEAVKHTDSQTPPDGLNNSEKLADLRNQLSSRKQPHVKKPEDHRDPSQIQEEIRSNAGGKRRKPTAKQHLQSLLFGLGIGSIAVIIFLFGFFNEVIIAPFIQPARTSAATPLIINSDTVAPSSEPQVIIPKINVQIPIQFDITANDEATMQKELESGVAHYPTTSQPGQNGNSAYFGHSSNNIFNKGKYKFAFVLLHELVPGDTFYITKDNKIYAYKVFDKKVVEPNQVTVLDPIPGHTATATLITCDPPGTSLHRLVVVGDQISPDPSTNIAATTEATNVTPAEQLTSNGQTLLGRFVSQPIGKLTLLAAAIIIAFIVIRKLNAKRN